MKNSVAVIVLVVVLAWSACGASQPSAECARLKGNQLLAEACARGNAAVSRRRPRRAPSTHSPCTFKLVEDRLTITAERDCCTLSSLLPSICDDRSITKLELHCNLPSGYFSETNCSLPSRLTFLTVAPGYGVQTAADTFTGLQSLIGLEVRGIIPSGDRNNSILAPLASSLVYLDAGGTLVPFIHGALKNLMTLKALLLDQNEFTEIPSDAFASLYAVELLDLSGNSIARLPAGIFGSMTNLLEVWMNSNLLASLDQDIFRNNTLLRSVSIAGNKLSSIPGGLLTGFLELEALDLSSNKLTDFSDSLIHAVPSLQSLDLSFNQLGRVPNVSSLLNLLDLNFDGNRLTAFPTSTIRNNRRLEYLGLSDNKITSFPRDLYLHRDMRGIDISHNGAIGDPPSLNGTTVARFMLQGNNFKTVSIPTVSSTFINAGGMVDISCQSPCLLATDDDTFASQLQPLSEFHAVNVMLTAANLHVLWQSNWSKLSIGGSGVCVKGQSLNIDLANSSLRELHVKETNCVSISIENSRLDVLRLISNSALRNASINQAYMLEFTLRNNPDLRFLNTVASISYLDISGTSLPYNRLYCTRLGAGVFAANDMLDPSTWSNNVYNLMRQCGYIPVLQLQNNRFMNNPTLVARALREDPFAYSVTDEPIDNLWVKGKSLQALTSTPVLDFSGTPTTCSWSVKTFRASSKAALGRNIFSSDVNVLESTCNCSLGHTMDADGVCSLPRTKAGISVTNLAFALVGTCMFWLLFAFVLVKRKAKHKYQLLQSHAEDLQSDIEELENARNIPESSIRLDTNRLGEGAYGEAWSGMLNEDPVCVKVLKAGGDHLNDGEAREQYDKELGGLLRVSHENVVGFRGAGVFSETYSCRAVRGRPFLVLELMEGGALTRYVRSLPDVERLDWGCKLQILLDVARGVEYIHSKKWVYRDLKADNVLLTKGLRAKVADFGTTKLAGRRTAGDGVAASGKPRFALARASSVATEGPVGTPLYMPPEIHRGESFTQIGDVFSYGQLLWEVAMERVPDPSSDNPEWFRRGPYLTRLAAFWDSGRRLQLARERVPMNEYAVLYGRCVEGATKLRPQFKDIVVALESAIRLRTQFNSHVVALDAETAV